MGRSQLRRIRTLYCLIERRCGVDTVDVSRIVAEEDTTKRRECAEQICLPGNGSLDAVDITSGSQLSACAPLFRHDGGGVSVYLVCV